MKVPFFSLGEIHAPLKEAFLNATSRIIDKNGFILGEEVARFEAEFAAYCGTTSAVGVGNGLDALKIALKALGIGAGDEVIVPAHTYIATWLAVSEVGAVPVPVDADADTMNIDVLLIEPKITRKTKAIIPVHLYGQMCDMKSIAELAEKHKLLVIEDFAQAQGATLDGQKAGSFGDLNCTSFYPGKNIGALGDAGMITTDDPEMAAKACKIRNYGSALKYEHELLGVNSRLDTLQAAFLSIKLKHLDAWNAERNKIANWYQTELEPLPQIKLQSLHPSAKSVYHQFTIRTNRRNELQEHLKNAGIDTLIHYPTPPSLQEAYAGLGYRKGDFPMAEQIASEILSLPIFPGLKSEQVIHVCASIRNFFK